MISEESDPTSSRLHLPLDFYRTPSTGTRLAAYAFPLAIDPAGSAAGANSRCAAPGDALVGAAFGILLFRYNAQSAVVLNASRITDTGDICWRKPLHLSTEIDAISRSVMDQAGEFLRRLDSTASDRETADRHSERSRAAITFLESTGAQDFDAGADALKIIEKSSLESRQDDLQLVVARRKGIVYAAFHYNSNLFKQTSIERLAGHLRELLTQISANPNAPISKLPLLAAAERRWIESVCSGRPRQERVEYAHRSFEMQAAANPEATALRFMDQSLTYRRLNSSANALARYLTANGVGVESRIVVCLEPSFDVAIALLAILKAGAVYVPLDPAYPLARIRASLEDIRPRLVITRAHLAEKIPADGVATLLLDDFENLTAGLSHQNPDLAVRPEQTAYIYYTSGTTGKPNGAAASQANLASYIHSARERYQIGRSDVMPAIARFGFSISMFELMSPLAAGGTLVLLERGHILDLDRMARTLAEVTVFHAGPSFLKNLLRHVKMHYPDLGAFSRVRHASSGGDTVSPEVLEGLKQVFSNAEVFVIYGCSEISCMGCTYPVSRDRPLERTFVGRPFDNMLVRVLDSALNLVPVGVVGEIFFAGDGIVKGYLNRPDLTAERFFDLDGRRFYRTGDVGRLNEDGWLELLGRRDFQVKLRGIRIELSEVEYNLRRAPGVRDGVVTARRLAEGEQSLVAYVVMDRGGGEPGRDEPPMAAVRRYMTERLPDYMVPSKYVELESLPLNHNMKVDRHALPEPEASICPTAGAGFREPQTATEKRLASLWMRLLGLDRIGLDDHFFDLGGHSVLGVTLILDVESELGVVLTGMEVLREPLEGQAEICDRRKGKVAAFADSMKSKSSPAAPDNDFEVFHFGEDRSLYGVLSGAVSGADRKRAEAVLICSSIGQERVRSHFVLQRLAKRLAAQGVPALRFDYYGCGDSLGESSAATCGRWQRDIREAYRELKRRTRAARITAVGVRVGAALLGNVASDLDLARLVLWDPVCDGSKYCGEMAETHAKFVRSWRWLFRGPPVCVPGGAELIGLACSEANMRELEALAFPPDPSWQRLPLKWLATHHTELQTDLFRRFAPEQDGSRLETLDFDSGWIDIPRLGHLMPDIGVSARLAAMATEQS